VDIPSAIVPVLLSLFVFTALLGFLATLLILSLFIRVKARKPALLPKMLGFAHPLYFTRPTSKAFSDSGEFTFLLWKRVLCLEWLSSRKTEAFYERAYRVRLIKRTNDASLIRLVRWTIGISRVIEVAFFVLIMCWIATLVGLFF